MAITQDRLVKLLSAATHYKTRLDEIVIQSRALAKTEWMSAEEKWTTLAALVQALDSGPADVILMQEQVHYKVYGKANERKKMWRQQTQPRQQKPEWELPRLQEPEPPPIAKAITMDSIEEEVHEALMDMTEDVKQNYYRNADPITKKIMEKQNPVLAAMRESELATQQLEAQMKRNPQDFFSANLPDPEAQP